MTASPVVDDQVCPRCHGPMERVPRLWRDRLLSLWRPVRRYRCTGWRCGWEGALPRHPQAAVPAERPPAAGANRRP